MDFILKEAQIIKHCGDFNYHPTYITSLNISVDTFVSFFDTIFLSKNDDEIVGFLFSIGPFITKNLENVKKKHVEEIWDGFIKLSIFVNHGLQLDALCEAMSTMCLHTLGMTDAFLDYLIDPKIQNSEIKVQILISLYPYLPERFLQHNAELFAKLISQFMIKTKKLQFIFCLGLINELEYSYKHFLEIDDFEINFWTPIYKWIQKDPSCYPSIVGELIEMKRKHKTKGFFENSCPFLKSKIREIVAINEKEKSSLNNNDIQMLLPISRLIPFLSINDIRILIPNIIEILAFYFLYNDSIPKDLLLAFEDAQKFIEVNIFYEVAMCIYKIIAQYVESSFYPSTLFLLGIFLDKISIHFKDSFEPILYLLISGLESNYPLKYPIVCAINENVDLLIGRDKFNDINNKIICNMFNLIKESKNLSDIKWAFKTLISYIMNIEIISPSFEIEFDNIQNQILDNFPSYSEILKLPDIISTNFPNFSLHYFYKFFGKYIKIFHGKLQEKSGDFFASINKFIFSRISQFESADINNPNYISNLNEKAEICNIIRIICKINPENLKTLFETGVKLSMDLILTVDSSVSKETFKFSFHLLSFFYKTDKDKKISPIKNIEQIIPFISKVTSQDLITSTKIQMKIMKYVSNITSIPFPEEIIHNFLKKGHEYQNMALILLLKYIPFIEKETLYKFIKTISILLKLSNDPNVVNNSFIFFSKIINSLSDQNSSSNTTEASSLETVATNSEFNENYAIIFIDDIVLSVFQGRLRIFHHAMGNNYINDKFKFYQFFCYYTIKFPQKAKRFIDELLYWLLHTSEIMIPKILKVMDIAFGMKLINFSNVNDLTSAILYSVHQNYHNYSIIKSGISLLMKIRKKFINNFKNEDFILLLEKIWEDAPDNEDITTFLIPVFLKIFSEKEFNISGDFQLFNDMSLLIAEEEFELNYPKIIKYYISMYENNIPFFSFEKNFALILAHFLVKTTKSLLDQGFQYPFLQEMHKCYKQIVRNNKSAERFVDEYLSYNPVALNRIKYLKREPKLPEF